MTSLSPAKLVLLGTLAHRGQPGPGRQQAVGDALGEMRGKLLGQRLRSGAHQHGGALQNMVCVGPLSNTVLQLRRSTVLHLCWSKL